MKLLNLVRVGAELKFTRGRHVMTGVVKWIGQRPQGSNKTFIGVEAAEDVMDPGKYLQIFENFNFFFKIRVATCGKVEIRRDRFS